MTEPSNMFHAIDPNDQLFCHNIKLSTGRLVAISFARQLHPEWDRMRSPYEAFTRETEKEAAFELVRAERFANCPPRLGAIFLFPTREAADRANQRWWNNQRVILPAQIVVPHRSGTFDAKLLNAKLEDWQTAADQHWSGTVTEDPSSEVLVDGVVQLEGWEPYGHLFGMLSNKDGHA